MATVQPDGKVPGVPPSKRIVSAEAIEHPSITISKSPARSAQTPMVQCQSDDWVRTPLRRSSEFRFNTSLDGACRFSLSKTTSGLPVNWRGLGFVHCQVDCRNAWGRNRRGKQAWEGIHVLDSRPAGSHPDRRYGIKLKDMTGANMRFCTAGLLLFRTWLSDKNTPP
jgi:hypothetical protein